MIGSASISPCGTYRWKLRREWAEGGPAIDPLVVVMLNPSTADASQDDPTIRRCIGYAKTLGHDSLLVVNLYALRSTDPKALWKHPDPVGHLNDEMLAEAVQEGCDVICAWGANARPDRVAAFAKIVEDNGGNMFALAVTKDGARRHPLYLRKDAEPVRWPATEKHDGQK